MRARAVWFAARRTVELREEDVPAPGQGEITVRTLVSGISQGTEMLVYRGSVAPDLSLDLPTFKGSFAFPIRYGYAVVGRIEAVGPGVPLHVGETVFVHHPHQTLFSVPAALAVPLPAGVTPEVGVLLANLETAVNVLLDVPVSVGETVVIFGQGVVGLLIAALVRRIPGVDVIAVEPSARRREAARALGVEVLLDPARADVLGTVMHRTAGRGADVVIEASGHPAVLQGAIEVAAMEARLVVVSWYGTKPVTLDLGRAFHRRRLRVVSSQVGHLPGRLAPRWDVSRRREVAARLLAELPLASLISHRIPLERAAEAFALVETRADETVQVVLTYG